MTGVVSVTKTADGKFVPYIWIADAPLAGPMRDRIDQRVRHVELGEMDAETDWQKMRLALKQPFRQLYAAMVESWDEYERQSHG